MSKKILIVDDSDSLRQVVNITLVSEGYNVIEAADGIKGLNQLEANDIQLIISDINMPNMNGIDFVKKVRKLKQHKFTPIILLTTENQQEMIEKGRSAGASAWVVKPFNPSQMLQAVSMLIAL